MNATQNHKQQQQHQLHHHHFNNSEKIDPIWAEVVPQLVEQSLPTPERLTKF